MSGPVIRNPVPVWMRPENASVLDSPLEKAIKALASLLGANDPNSQVMGLMNPAEVAGGVSPVAQAIEAISKKVKGIKAYHGSPHDFDKFSLDKIGTGEGAQAYGHGLYFAENEGVAKSYKDMWPADQRGPRVKVDGQNLYDLAAAAQSPVERRAYKRLIEDGDIDSAIRNAAPTSAYPDPEAQQVLVHWKQTRKIETPTGRMYEVNINADPEDFLDWDAPLSQQSEKVKGALSRVAPKYGLPEADGNVLYQSLAHDLQGETMVPGRKHLPISDAKAQVSGRLRGEGIPGIKYLDQGSRTAGQGTRNYVVFDDKLISIVKKYGILGALSAGLINDAQARQLAEQGYGQ